MPNSRVQQLFFVAFFLRRARCPLKIYGWENRGRNNATQKIKEERMRLVYYPKSRQPDTIYTSSRMQQSIRGSFFVLHTMQIWVRKEILGPPPQSPISDLIAPFLVTVVCQIDYRAMKLVENESLWCLTT